MAVVLGVPIAALFGDDEIGGKANTNDLLMEILSQPYAARLLRAFHAVKHAKKRLALVKLAERMGKNTG